MKRFLCRLSRRLDPAAPFSVVLVNDALIRSYNQQFRGNNRPTDVLSFPYEKDGWEEESYLGDILVSVETAHRQRKGTLLEELKVLSLHGLLHLLGYDHETDRGEMEDLERRLKREFKLH